MMRKRQACRLQEDDVHNQRNQPTRSLSYDSFPNSTEIHVYPIKTDVAWSLCEKSTSDALANPSKKPTRLPKLPLASFNHIAREVASVDATRQFYVDILGFIEVPRPPLDSVGFWLYGYGLSLHLVQSSFVFQRKKLRIDRLRHFTTALPRVDHIAFISDDLQAIRKILDEAKVFYKYDAPHNTGIEQLFIFDPDGNVIEVSNCQPPVGKIACKANTSEEEQEIRESIMTLEARGDPAVSPIAAPIKSLRSNDNLEYANCHSDDDSEDIEYAALHPDNGYSHNQDFDVDSLQSDQSDGSADQHYGLFI